MSRIALATESHVAEVRRWFDLSPLDPSPKAQSPSSRCSIPPPQAGQLVLITGPSGSGKSRRIARLRRRWRNLFHILNLDAIVLPDRPTVDCLPGLELSQTLRQLCQVGLAQTRTWLLPPKHLSQGQRWRLKLAVALGYARCADRPSLLVADEFAGCLDPLTARIVAHVLHRQLEQFKLCALIATSRDDLLTILHPDRIIECDFENHW